MNDQQPTTSGEPAPVQWAELAGRPATPESLLALTGADPTAMTGAALVDAVVASEKALSLLAATQMRLLSALAVPFVAGDPMRLAAVLARKNCITKDDDPEQVAHFVPQAAASLAATEVAAALRIPCRTASLRVEEADTMTGALTPTLNALEEGLLDRVKARVIAEHCAPLDPEQTQDLQDLVLPGVEELTTSELRDVAGQAVIIVDPDGAENRHQEAAARRELRMQPLPDGMATLKANLPADGAVKIFQVSDLLATGTAGTPGDNRGIGARRVDALVDIADHLLTHGFVDLTDYLGEELPDHGTPTPRARPAPRTSTNPSGNDSTGEGAGPAVDTDATGTDAAQPENGGATGDDGAAEVPDHTEAPATASASTDNDASPSADDTTVGPIDDDRDDQPSATTETTNSHTDTVCGTDASPSPGAAGTEAATGATAATATTTKRRGGNRVFTRQGRRPHLSVTLGLGTLAGLDNLPGSLAGFGAIPAGLARSIAASAATINALVTDPDTGRVTAAGALTYRTTQELRDQIAAILNVCQFPSCRQPVWRCDMDHREEFNHHHPEQGGKTDPENVGPFCKRHHLIKHHSDWRIRIDPNRYVLEFTSPTGHHYRKPGRQAAAPGLWVSTAATAIAERLDDIANPPSTLVRRPDGEPAPTSPIDDLLATILIRHHLNTKTVEIDYHPETAWETVDQDDPPPF